MAGVGAGDRERVEIGLPGPVRLSVGGVARPLRSLPGRVLLARGGDLIGREAAGYRLLLAPDRIDTGPVERLVAEARSAAVADPAGGALPLGRALGVFRRRQRLARARGVRHRPGAARPDVAADRGRARARATGGVPRLHDLGDPPAALRRAHEVPADGGLLIAVEPWSTDRSEDGVGHPTVRIEYASSTALCTPGSLAQPEQYGLGTQGGPARRIQLLAEAGFGQAGLAADTGFNLVLAAVK